MPDDTRAASPAQPENNGYPATTFGAGIDQGEWITKSNIEAPEHVKPNGGGNPVQSRLSIVPKVMDRPIRINGAAKGAGQLDKARNIFRKWLGDDYTCPSSTEH